MTAEPLRNLFRHRLRFAVMWLALVVGTLAALAVAAVLRTTAILLQPWIPPGVIEIHVDAPRLDRVGPPERLLGAVGLDGHEVGLGIIEGARGMTLANFGFSSLEVLRGYYPQMRLQGGRWPGRGEAVVPLGTCRRIGCRIGEVLRTRDGDAYALVGLVTSPELGPILAVKRPGGLPPAWTLWARHDGRSPGAVEAAVLDRLQQARVRPRTLRVDDADSLGRRLRSLNTVLLAMLIPGAVLGLLAAALLIVFNFAVNRFERAKEVAVKRVLGASRLQIVLDSLAEALAVFALAVPPALAAGWALWLKLHTELAAEGAQNFLFPEVEVVGLVAGTVLALVLLGALGPSAALAFENASARLKEE